jgi:DNA invertase Pin-like site-specific DNA recombinase
MKEHRPVTNQVPTRPAGYVRVAAATSPGDLAVARQRQAVQDYARHRGWPEPAIYTDTGPACGPQHAALTHAISDGHHDAVILTDLARISHDPAQAETLTHHCHSHGTRIHLTSGQSIDNQHTATLHTRPDGAS